MAQHTAWLIPLMLVMADAGAVSQTRTAAFEYDPDTGLLIREILEPDDSNLCLVTTYARDLHGNVTSATTRNCNGTSSGGLTEAPAPTGNAVIQPRTITTQYGAGSVTIDAVVYSYPAGLFPTAVTNALNQTETRKFDVRFGAMHSVTGPNGLTTSWARNRFGHKTAETRPDSTTTTWSYTFCGSSPNYCGRALTVMSTGAPTSITRYDSLHRTIRTEVAGFTGTQVLADTEYDSLGRVSRVSRPYFANAAPVWTSFTYDLLGRVVTQTDPLGGVTTKTYAGLESTTTNPLNHKEKQFRNSQGQVRRVQRF